MEVDAKPTSDETQDQIRNLVNKQRWFITESAKVQVEETITVD